MNNKYIIVEIIPTSSNKATGVIAQIQALKIDDLKLKDRFDYRLDNSLINNQDLIDLISYDKDMFNYTNSSLEIMDKFKDFIEDYKLLIIDNKYTLDYLNDINNLKESVFKYLNTEYSEDVFNILINKYKLEPSNHLVDLLYESLIAESNNI